MNRKNILTFFISSVVASQLFASMDSDIQNATKIELNNKSIDIKRGNLFNFWEIR